MKENKKIFLILAGGTCILNEDKQILAVQSQDDINDWLETMPELKILADIEPIFLAGEDETLGRDIWPKIIATISENSEQADGFVVVCKIDQLINAAVATSFALQNFKKTIVFTSSQVSGTDFINKKQLISNLKSKQGGFTLRSNLINAIQISRQPLPQPAIMFGTLLMPAIKSVKSTVDDLNIFYSLDNEYWGKMDFGMNVKSGLKYNKQKSKIYNKGFSDILVIENIPGVPWFFDKKYLSKYRGIFIKVDPYQKLEKFKQEQIDKWKQPVVLYNYNLTYSIKGAVSIFHCTASTAMVKMMWALANQSKTQTFENLINQNILGEFID